MYTIIFDAVRAIGAGQDAAIESGHSVRTAYRESDLWRGFVLGLAPSFPEGSTAWLIQPHRFAHRTSSCYPATLALITPVVLAPEVSVSLRFELLAGAVFPSCRESGHPSSVPVRRFS